MISKLGPLYWWDYRSALPPLMTGGRLLTAWLRCGWKQQVHCDKDKFDKNFRNIPGCACVKRCRKWIVIKDNHHQSSKDKGSWLLQISKTKLSCIRLFLAELAVFHYESRRICLKTKFRKTWKYKRYWTQFWWAVYMYMWLDILLPCVPVPVLHQL